MYPILHASYEGSFFIYQWAYLLGQTKHYSPLLHVLGMVLRRITREDLVSTVVVVIPPLSVLSLCLGLYS